MGFFSRNKEAVKQTEPQPVRQEEAAAEFPAEIAAVIAAAIEAFGGTAFVIKTIRRKGAACAPTWSMAGRQELMETRRF